MSEPLLHEQSRRGIDAFLQGRGQVLLLSGAVGLGKQTVAQFIAQRLGQNIQTYDGQDASTGIDDVRSMLQHGKFKRTESEPVIFVINSADFLGVEAQNALLKMVEEPTASTYFILTTISPRGILPTIMSRAQHLALQSPPQQALKEHFSKQGFTEARIERVLRVSGGLPGLSASLLEDKEHPFLSTIEQAKEFLSAKPFERLAIADKLSKDRPQALLFVQAVLHVCHAALKHAATNGNATAVSRWASSAATALSTAESLSANGNTKIALDYASLHL